MNGKQCGFESHSRRNICHFDYRATTSSFPRYCISCMSCAYRTHIVDVYKDISCMCLYAIITCPMYRINFKYLIPDKPVQCLVCKKTSSKELHSPRGMHRGNIYIYISRNLDMLLLEHNLRGGGGGMCVCLNAALAIIFPISSVATTMQRVTAHAKSSTLTVNKQSSFSVMQAYQ